MISSKECSAQSNYIISMYDNKDVDSLFISWGYSQSVSLCVCVCLFVSSCPCISCHANTNAVCFAKTILLMLFITTGYIFWFNWNLFHLWSQIPSVLSFFCANEQIKVSYSIGFYNSKHNSLVNINTFAYVCLIFYPLNLSWMCMGI